MSGGAKMGAGSKRYRLIAMLRLRLVVLRITIILNRMWTIFLKALLWLTTAALRYSRLVKIGLALILFTLVLMTETNIWAWCWLGLGASFTVQQINQKRYSRATLLAFITGALFNASLYGNTPSNALMLTGWNYGWQLWDWWTAKPAPVETDNLNNSNGENSDG